MTNTYLNSGLFGELLHDADCSALFAAPQVLHHMLRFEHAYTAALAECGLVTPEHAQAACAAIQRSAPDLADLAAGSVRDGIPVPALVAVLRKDLPPEVAKAIHTGATSQDVLDTAMVLSLRAALALCAQRLTALIAQLDQLERTFGTSQMMGRTRMQAALPIPVAHRLSVWKAPLVARLSEADSLAAALPVQFGGAVGLRQAPGTLEDPNATTDPDKGRALAHALARQLDLPASKQVWHADRSPIANIGGWATLTCGALGKIGQDIALMAQQGVEEVRLAGAGGSSAMPHKQNPVLAEILVTLARFTAAQNGGLGQALVHEQERSGQAWALEWMLLPPMVEATATALRHGTTLLGSVQKLGQPTG